MIVCTIILVLSVSVRAQCPCNLIANGDFEAGNTDFATEYNYLVPPTYLHPDGQYTVYTNPNLVHGGFTSYGDHTSGAGNMLIVNADADGYFMPDVSIVWQQTVDVIPNTDYVFTYWLSSCHPAAPANMKCSINGSVIGTQLAPSTAGIWTEVSHSWNSASNTSVTITLEDLTRAYSGDDFAIDDISLCAPAQVFDLCAGQSDDIGEVVVWNDSDNIYVEFVTDEVLLETHVHVATSLQGIPQTKKFNPIPGQFDSAKYIPDEHLHTIPLDPGRVDQQIVVAAHAAIGEPATLSECSSLENTEADGPLSAYAFLDSGNWSGYGPSVACWVHPSWPSITGATWVSTEYDTTDDPVNDSWRKFRHVIDIPGLPIEATITATSDNAEAVYLNGEFIGSDGEVQGVFEDDWEWQTIVDYLDDGTNLLPGQNDLEFIVRNYAQPGGNATSNPTGLIYCVEVNYYEGGDTAWGDGCIGTSFSGSNWGTYFIYTVNACE